MLNKSVVFKDITTIVGFSKHSTMYNLCVCMCECVII